MKKTVASSAVLLLISLLSGCVDPGTGGGESCISTASGTLFCPALSLLGDSGSTTNGDCRSASYGSNAFISDTAGANSFYLDATYSPLADVTVATVRLGLKKISCVAGGSVYLEVWTDSAGLPGTRVKTTGTLDPCSISASAGSVSFSFDSSCGASCSPPSLSGGTRYHFVLIGQSMIPGTVLSWLSTPASNCTGTTVGVLGGSTAANEWVGPYTPLTGTQVGTLQVN